MKRTYFHDLLKSNGIRFSSWESVEDLEMQYSIILEVRGKAKSPDYLDEKLALAILCKLPWPGKTTKYKIAVRKLRQSFIGIAGSRELQNKFRKLVSKKLVEARTESEISLTNIKDAFNL